MAKAPSEPGQIALFSTGPVLPDPYKKAVQVIHSVPRGAVSFTQKKAMNALVAHAIKSQMDEDGWWTISNTALFRSIGFDSHNREYIRQTIRDLTGITFEWNYLKGDESGPWMKASVLFTDVEITADRFRYRINSTLQRDILNPERYAIVDLEVMRQFKRSASLTIYEHCVRYEGIGHTGTVPWELFRDHVLGKGKHTSTYDEYKYFKAKVLKPAIAEINSVGAQQITLKETFVGRRIEGIAFDISKRPVQKLEEALDDEETLHLVKEIVEVGVAASEARRIVRENVPEKIKAALQATKKRMQNKKLASLEKPGAYFRSALKNGWADTDEAAVQPRGRTKDAKRDEKTDRELLQERYLSEQMAEAEQYFKELDSNEQTELIERYNAQQPTAGLKITKKPGKAATAGFWRWLGLQTWGEPTPEDLLRFLMQQGAGSGPAASK